VRAGRETLSIGIPFELRAILSSKYRVSRTDRELLSDDKEQQSYIAYKDKLP